MWGINAKHTRRSAATILLLLAMICLTILGCMKIMPVRSAAVTATVVDEETGLPLEHVVVVGMWPNIRGTLAGSVEVGLIEKKKVVTDAQGKFLLPGWSKPGIGLESPGLTATGPDIHLYKVGYWPRRLQNPAEQYDRIIIWPDAWRSDWNGKTIKLKPMHWESWTVEEWRANRRKTLGTKAMKILSFPDGCSWTRSPKDIVVAIRFWIRMKSTVYPHSNLYKKFGPFLDDSRKQCDVDPFELLHKAGLTFEEWGFCCAPQSKRRGKMFVMPPPVRGP